MAASFRPEELEALVPRLRRYARALTGSREAADDLTQDTLERAWIKRALWQPGTDLRAWTFTLMHNVFINDTRRGRLPPAPDGLVDRVTAEGTSAETSAVLDELERALALLPSEQREVLLLVGLEQFAYGEAAEVLGIPLGTVMSRLSRARERLRLLLETGAAAAERATPLRRVK